MSSGPKGTVGGPRPLVSLVIANYPDAVLVRETLESVREDIAVEVIVVDDASPVPGTGEALQAYAAEGLIDVLQLETTNRGHQHAFNVGIGLATAPLIYILGNDDLLRPGALGKLAALLGAHPDASFACGSYERFGGARGIYTPPAWDPWRLLFQSPYPGSYMVRREANLAVGGVQRNAIFEDWDTYLAYAEHGMHGVVLDEIVYDYRIHDTTRLSAQGQRSYRTQFELLRTAHAEFFARASDHRRASGASFALKLAFPIYRFIRLRTPRRVIQLAHRIVFGQRRAAGTS